MMLGHVDMNNRGYAYIEPDNVDDPWVWVRYADVSRLSLVQGTTVLYLPRRTRGVWEASVLDTDLSRIVHSPTLWQIGQIDGVFKNYLFIKPDLGPPNVMCLPSATTYDYEPSVGDRVLFRAGPSEKSGSHYQQAIHLRKISTTYPLHDSVAPDIDHMIALCDDDSDVAAALCDPDTSQDPQVVGGLCDGGHDVPSKVYDNDTCQIVSSVTRVRPAVWGHPIEAVDSDTDVEWYC